MIKFSLTALLMLTLTACATMPTPESAYNQKMSWPHRAATLKKINRWKMEGAVAVHLPQNALSAYLNWQQDNQHYTLHLFGPLGIGAVNITGQPGSFILRNSKGQTFKANSPEQLIQNEMGWTLPLSDLYYWIRGLPDPKMQALKQFDAFHHLIKLNQSGWDIRYLQYAGIHNVDLPSKITLSNKQISLRIIINRWDLL